MSHGKSGHHHHDTTVPNRETFITPLTSTLQRESSFVKMDDSQDFFPNDLSMEDDDDAIRQAIQPANQMKFKIVGREADIFHKEDWGDDFDTLSTSSIELRLGRPQNRQQVKLALDKQRKLATESGPPRLNATTSTRPSSASSKTSASGNGQSGDRRKRMSLSTIDNSQQHGHPTSNTHGHQRPHLTNRGPPSGDASSTDPNFDGWLDDDDFREIEMLNTHVHQAPYLSTDISPYTTHHSDDESSDWEVDSTVGGSGGGGGRASGGLQPHSPYVKTAQSSSSRHGDDDSESDWDLEDSDENSYANLQKQKQQQQQKRQSVGRRPSAASSGFGTFDKDDEDWDAALDVDTSKGVQQASDRLAMRKFIVDDDDDDPFEESSGKLGTKHQKGSSTTQSGGGIGGIGSHKRRAQMRLDHKLIGALDSNNATGRVDIIMYPPPPALYSLTTADGFRALGESQMDIFLSTLTRKHTIPASFKILLNSQPPWILPDSTAASHLNILQYLIYAYQYAFLTYKASQYQQTWDIVSTVITYLRLTIKSSRTKSIIDDLSAFRVIYHMLILISKLWTEELTAPAFLEMILHCRRLLFPSFTHLLELLEVETIAHHRGKYANQVINSLCAIYCKIEPLCDAVIEKLHLDAEQQKNTPHGGGRLPGKHHTFTRSGTLPSSSPYDTSTQKAGYTTNFSQLNHHHHHNTSDSTSPPPPPSSSSSSSIPQPPAFNRSTHHLNTSIGGTTPLHGIPDASPRSSNALSTVYSSSACSTVSRGNNPMVDHDTIAIETALRALVSLHSYLDGFSPLNLTPLGPEAEWDEDSSDFRWLEHSALDHPPPFLHAREVLVNGVVRRFVYAHDPTTKEKVDGMGGGFQLLSEQSSQRFYDTIHASERQLASSLETIENNGMLKTYRHTFEKASKSADQHYKSLSNLVIVTEDQERARADGGVGNTMPGANAAVPLPSVDQPSTIRSNASLREEYELSRTYCYSDRPRIAFVSFVSTNATAWKICGSYADRVERIKTLYEAYTPMTWLKASAALCLARAQLCADDDKPPEVHFIAAERLLMEALYIIDNLTDSITQQFNSETERELLSVPVDNIPAHSQLASMSLELFASVLITLGKYKYSILALDAAQYIHEIRHGESFSIIRKMCEVSLQQRDYPRAILYHFKLLIQALNDGNLETYVYITLEIAKLYAHLGCYRRAEEQLRCGLSFLLVLISPSTQSLSLEMVEQMHKFKRQPYCPVPEGFDAQQELPLRRLVRDTSVNIEIVDDELEEETEMGSGGNASINTALSPRSAVSSASSSAKTTGMSTDTTMTNDTSHHVSPSAFSTLTPSQQQRLLRRRLAVVSDATSPGSPGASSDAQSTTRSNGTKSQQQSSGRNGGSGSGNVGVSTGSGGGGGQRATSSPSHTPTNDHPQIVEDHNYGIRPPIPHYTSPLVQGPLSRMLTVPVADIKSFLGDLIIALARMYIDTGKLVHALVLLEPIRASRYTIDGHYAHFTPTNQQSNITLTQLLNVSLKSRLFLCSTPLPYTSAYPSSLEANLLGLSRDSNNSPYLQAGLTEVNSSTIVTKLVPPWVILSSLAGDLVKAKTATIDLMLAQIYTKLSFSHKAYKVLSFMESSLLRPKVTPPPTGIFGFATGGAGKHEHGFRKRVFTMDALKAQRLALMRMIEQRARERGVGVNQINTDYRLGYLVNSILVGNAFLPEYPKYNSKLPIETKRLVVQENILFQNPIIATDADTMADGSCIHITQQEDIASPTGRDTATSTSAPGSVASSGSTSRRSTFGGSGYGSSVRSRRKRDMMMKDRFFRERKELPPPPDPYTTAVEVLDAVDFSGFGQANNESMLASLGLKDFVSTPEYVETRAIQAQLSGHYKLALLWIDKALSVRNLSSNLYGRLYYRRGSILYDLYIEQMNRGVNADQPYLKYPTPIGDPEVFNDVPLHERRDFRRRVEYQRMITEHNVEEDKRRKTEERQRAKSMKSILSSSSSHHHHHTLSATGPGLQTPMAMAMPRKPMTAGPDFFHNHHAMGGGVGGTGPVGPSPMSPTATTAPSGAFSIPPDDYQPGTEHLIDSGYIPHTGPKFVLGEGSTAFFMPDPRQCSQALTRSYRNYEKNDRVRTAEALRLLVEAYLQPVFIAVGVLKYTFHDLAPWFSAYGFGLGQGDSTKHPLDQTYSESEANAIQKKFFTSIEFSVMTAISVASSAFSPLLMIQCLLNLAELRYLQDNLELAYLYWNEARLSFFAAFVVNNEVVLPNRWNFQHLRDIQELLRRLVRMLMTFNTTIINDNLDLIDTFVSFDATMHVEQITTQTQEIIDNLRASLDDGSLEEAGFNPTNTKSIVASTIMNLVNLHTTITNNAGPGALSPFTMNILYNEEYVPTYKQHDSNPARSVVVAYQNQAQQPSLMVRPNQYYNTNSSRRNSLLSPTLTPRLSGQSIHNTMGQSQPTTAPPQSRRFSTAVGGAGGDSEPSPHSRPIAPSYGRCGPLLVKDLDDAIRQLDKCNSTVFTGTDIYKGDKELQYKAEAEAHNVSNAHLVHIKQIQRSILCAIIPNYTPNGRYQLTSAQTIYAHNTLLNLVGSSASLLSLSHAYPPVPTLNLSSPYHNNNNPMMDPVGIPLQQSQQPQGSGGGGMDGNGNGGVGGGNSFYPTNSHSSAMLPRVQSNDLVGSASFMSNATRSPSSIDASTIKPGSFIMNGIVQSHKNSHYHLHRQNYLYDQHQLHIQQQSTQQLPNSESSSTRFTPLKATRNLLSTSLSYQSSNLHDGSSKFEQNRIVSPSPSSDLYFNSQESDTPQNATDHLLIRKLLVGFDALDLFDALPEPPTFLRNCFQIANLALAPLSTILTNDVASGVLPVNPDVYEVTNAGGVGGENAGLSMSHTTTGHIPPSASHNHTHGQMKSSITSPGLGSGSIYGTGGAGTSAGRRVTYQRPGSAAGSLTTSNVGGINAPSGGLTNDMSTVGRASHTANGANPSQPDHPGHGSRSAKKNIDQRGYCGWVTIRPEQQNPPHVAPRGIGNRMTDVKPQLTNYFNGDPLLQAKGKAIARNVAHYFAELDVSTERVFCNELELETIRDKNRHTYSQLITAMDRLRHLYLKPTPSPIIPGVGLMNCVCMALGYPSCVADCLTTNGRMAYRLWTAALSHQSTCQTCALTQSYDELLFGKLAPLDLRSESIANIRLFSSHHFPSHPTVFYDCSDRSQFNGPVTYLNPSTDSQLRLPIPSHSQTTAGLVPAVVSGAVRFQPTKLPIKNYTHVDVLLSKYAPANSSNHRMMPIFTTDPYFDVDIDVTDDSDSDYEPVDPTVDGGGAAGGGGNKPSNTLQPHTHTHPHPAALGNYAAADIYMTQPSLHHKPSLAAGNPATQQGAGAGGDDDDDFGDFDISKSFDHPNRSTQYSGSAQTEPTTPRGTAITAGTSGGRPGTASSGNTINPALLNKYKDEDDYENAFDDDSFDIGARGPSSALNKTQGSHGHTEASSSNPSNMMLGQPKTADLSVTTSYGLVPTLHFKPVSHGEIYSVFGTMENNGGVTVVPSSSGLSGGMGMTPSLGPVSLADTMAASGSATTPLVRPRNRVMSLGDDGDFDLGGSLSYNMNRGRPPSSSHVGLSTHHQISTSGGVGQQPNAQGQPNSASNHHTIKRTVIGNNCVYCAPKIHLATSAYHQQQSLPSPQAQITINIDDSPYDDNATIKRDPYPPPACPACGMRPSVPLNVAQSLTGGVVNGIPHIQWDNPRRRRHHSNSLLYAFAIGPLYFTYHPKSGRRLIRPFSADDTIIDTFTLPRTVNPSSAFIQRAIAELYQPDRTFIVETRDNLGDGCVNQFNFDANFIKQYKSSQTHRNNRLHQQQQRAAAVPPPQQPSGHPVKSTSMNDYAYDPYDPARRQQMMQSPDLYQTVPDKMGEARQQQQQQQQQQRGSIPLSPATPAGMPPAATPDDEIISTSFAASSGQTSAGATSHPPAPSVNSVDGVGSGGGGGNGGDPIPDPSQFTPFFPTNFQNPQPKPRKFKKNPVFHVSANLTYASVFDEIATSLPMPDNISYVPPKVRTIALPQQVITAPEETQADVLTLKRYAIPDTTYVSQTSKQNPIFFSKLCSECGVTPCCCFLPSCGPLYIVISVDPCTNLHGDFYQNSPFYSHRVRYEAPENDQTVNVRTTINPAVPRPRRKKPKKTVNPFQQQLFSSLLSLYASSGNTHHQQHQKASTRVSQSNHASSSTAYHHHPHGSHGSATSGDYPPTYHRNASVGSPALHSTPLSHNRALDSNPPAHHRTTDQLPTPSLDTHTSGGSLGGGANHLSHQQQQQAGRPISPSLTTNSNQYHHRQDEPHPPAVGSNSNYTSSGGGGGDDDVDFFSELYAHQDELAEKRQYEFYAHAVAKLLSYYDMKRRACPALFSAARKLNPSLLNTINHVSTQPLAPISLAHAQVIQVNLPKLHTLAHEFYSFTSLDFPACFPPRPTSDKEDKLETAMSANGLDPIKIKVLSGYEVFNKEYPHQPDTDPNVHSIIYKARFPAPTASINITAPFVANHLFATSINAFAPSTPIVCQCSSCGCGGALLSGYRPGDGISTTASTSTSTSTSASVDYSDFHNIPTGDATHTQQQQQQQQQQQHHHHHHHGGSTSGGYPTATTTTAGAGAGAATRRSPHNTNAPTPLASPPPLPSPDFSSPGASHDPLLCLPPLHHQPHHPHHTVHGDAILRADQQPRAIPQTLSPIFYEHHYHQDMLAQSHTHPHGGHLKHRPISYAVSTPSLDQLDPPSTTGTPIPSSKRMSQNSANSSQRPSSGISSTSLSVALSEQQQQQQYIHRLSHNSSHSNQGTPGVSYSDHASASGESSIAPCTCTPTPWPAHRIPVLGCTIPTKLPIYKRIAVADSESLLPPPLDTTALTKVLNVLDPSSIFLLLAALLCESRILLVSSSQFVINSVIDVMLALMYPFKWQNLRISLLHRSSGELLYHRRPYLIGILTQTLESFVKQKYDSLDPSVIMNGKHEQQSKMLGSTGSGNVNNMISVMVASLDLGPNIVIADLDNNSIRYAAGTMIPLPEQFKHEMARLFRVARAFAGHIGGHQKKINIMDDEYDDPSLVPNSSRKISSEQVYTNYTFAAYPTPADSARPGATMTTRIRNGFIEMMVRLFSRYVLFWDMSLKKNQKTTRVYGAINACHPLTAPTPQGRDLSDIKPFDTPYAYRTVTTYHDTPITSIGVPYPPILEQPLVSAHSPVDWYENLDFDLPGFLNYADPQYRPFLNAVARTSLFRHFIAVRHRLRGIPVCMYLFDQWSVLRVHNEWRREIEVKRMQQLQMVVNVARSGSFHRRVVSLHGPRIFIHHDAIIRKNAMPKHDRLLIPFVVRAIPSTTPTKQKHTFRLIAFFDDNALQILKDSETNKYAFDPEPLICPPDAYDLDYLDAIQKQASHPDFKKRSHAVQQHIINIMSQFMKGTSQTAWPLSLQLVRTSIADLSWEKDLQFKIEKESDFQYLYQALQARLLDPEMIRRYEKFT